MEYDEALLRVPLEAAARVARQETKRMEKEWATVHKALATLLSRETASGGGGVEGVCKGLEKVEAKLRGVVKKVEEGAAAQEAALQTIHRRAAFAVDAPARPVCLSNPAHVEFHRLNTLRLVAQFLLCANLLKSAHALVAEAGLTDLVDLHVFAQLYPIVDALTAGDTRPALAWCGENRARIAPLPTSLEVDLLVQECVNIATGAGSAASGTRSETTATHADPHAPTPAVDSSAPTPATRMQNVLRAMEFCRTRVAPLLRASGAAAGAPAPGNGAGAGGGRGNGRSVNGANGNGNGNGASSTSNGGGAAATTHADGAGRAPRDDADGGGDDPQLRLLKDLMGLLAGIGVAGVSTEVAQSYAYLLRPERCAELATEFASIYLTVFNVQGPPLFVMLLQAGVLGLNTHDTAGGGGGPSPNRADPMSSAHFQALVAGLPVLARKNSALVCPFTGRMMDDRNPPVVTPAGHLYSQAAVDDIIAQHSGLFVCPQTRETMSPSRLRRVYVL